LIPTRAISKINRDSSGRFAAWKDLNVSILAFPFYVMLLRSAFVKDYGEIFYSCCGLPGPAAMLLLRNSIRRPTGEVMLVRAIFRLEFHPQAIGTGAGEIVVR
jgi:hypothetical protein